MRILSRTRSTGTGDSGTGDSPGSGPRAVYARILDGDSLWLAVEEATGPLAIRDRATGRVTPLGSDLPDHPGLTSVRTNLAAQAGTGETGAVFDVVTLSRRGAKPVWIATPAIDDPITTPPSRDDRWQFTIRRSDDGFLRVRRDSLAPAAYVSSTASTAAGTGLTIQLRLSRAPSHPPRLALVDTENRSHPLTTVELHDIDDGAESRLWSGELTIAAVPSEPGVATLLAVVVGDEVWPVLRDHNDLRSPGRSVVLPGLTDPEGDTELVRVQYQHEARIRIWRPDPAGGAD